MNYPSCDLTFDKFIGNKNVVRNLKMSILNNKISHCYIIDGVKSSGKETIAKIFSKSILCENNYGNPCLECISCKTIDSLNNPDIFIIENEKKNLSITDVRENIIKNLGTKPFRHKYKIFIIKNSDLMTIQAQNALLKTMEEPPSFVIFILLSNNYNNFLPTVLSRCVLIKLKPLPVNLVQTYLVENGFSNQNDAKFYANYSRGSIGKSLQLINSESFIEFRKDIVNDIYKLDELDLIQMYKLISSYEKQKENLYEILDIYIITYRDALIFKQLGKVGQIVQNDIFDLLEVLSKMSLENLVIKLEALLITKSNLRQNLNMSLVLECLFLKLKEK